MSTFTVLKYCERYRQVTVSQSFLWEMFTTVMALNSSSQFCLNSQGKPCSLRLDLRAGVRVYGVAS